MAEIKATFVMGYIHMETGLPEFDKKGRLVGHGHVITRRDENGFITSREHIPAACVLVYENDDKKWWEFWK